MNVVNRIYDGRCIQTIWIVHSNHFYTSHRYHYNMGNKITPPEIGGNTTQVKLGTLNAIFKCCDRHPHPCLYPSYKCWTSCYILCIVEVTRHNKFIIYKILLDNFLFLSTCSHGAVIFKVCATKVKRMQRFLLYIGLLMWKIVLYR